MADADVPQDGSEEQRNPSTDAPPREPPGYDTNKEGYTGIPAGALADPDDVASARDFAEMIVDTIREGLLVLGFDLRVVAANESFYDQFEVRPEETVGRLVYDLGNGQWDLPELRELLEDILPHQKVFNDYEVDHAFEGLGQRYMLLNARRLDDHQLILLAIEDVTQRRQGEIERARAEAALRESEARFRQMAEAVPDVVFTTTPDGVVDYVSPRREEVTGQPPENALGTPMWPAIIHPDDRARTEAEREAAYAERRPFESRYRLRMRDGSYCWFIARTRPIVNGDGGITRWFGTLTDVDALTRAEEALRRLNETLEERVSERTQQVRQHEGRIRELSRALALAEQEERRRIAHVLHDDLQQVLFGAQMAASAGDAERLGVVLDEAMELTRSLSHELSPPFLEGEDVEGLLRWVADRKREQHGLEVDVEVHGDVPVPEPALRVLLYQLVRELLFNVVKHAGVGRARLVAERRSSGSDGHVRVVVEDEGVGFDPAELDEPTKVGLGLPSVRKRVELVGGELEVVSAPGEGTRVSIILPVGGRG